jgi:hypothetical protein
MHYINTETLEYPISENVIRARVNVSFSLPFVPLAPYQPVVATTPPSFDSVTQRLVESAPILESGVWTQAWEVQQFSQQEATSNLIELKTNSVLAIDSEVDAIYLAALGNRGPEYTDAEAAAVAYQAAGYTGTVPPDVQSWATAKGWTATQAADDILAAAASLRGAKSAIRAARLLRKEQVKAATTGAEVSTAMAAWAAFAAAIRAQLGV